jgi:hypothetical protein
MSLRSIVIPTDNPTFQNELVPEQHKRVQSSSLTQEIERPQAGFLSFLVHWNAGINNGRHRKTISDALFPLQLLKASHELLVEVLVAFEQWC